MIRGGIMGMAAGRRIGRGMRFSSRRGDLLLFCGGERRQARRRDSSPCSVAHGFAAASVYPSSPPSSPPSQPLQPAHSSPQHRHQPHDHHPHQNRIKHHQHDDRRTHQSHHNIRRAPTGKPLESLGDSLCADFEVLKRGRVGVEVPAC